MTIKTVLLAGAVALIPLAAQSEWKERLEIDRITGERLSAGIETVAHPEKPRPYPFSLVPGWLYLSCGGDVMFALLEEYVVAAGIASAVEFSDLDELTVRARVDDHVAEFQAENWRMDDSSAALFFPGTGLDSLYLAIVHAGNLLLEIPTVEYGDLYFSFDLAGTRALVGRTCGGAQTD